MRAANRPIPWFLSAALAAAGCCGENANNRSQRTVETYVGEDSKVQLDEIRFTDEATGDCFRRLHDDFASRGSAPGFHHYPLRKIGNFVQEDWCAEPGAEHGCSGGSFRERRGSEWLELYTLHYDSSWPEVFGLGVGAGAGARGCT